MLQITLVTHQLLAPARRPARSPPLRCTWTMNCQVHQLPELETATSGTREALQACIHTILFSE